MSKRYKRLLQATPNWVTITEKNEMKNMYRTAVKMSSIGRLFSVDHYYPLFGKVVCGLHTINNLMIITHKTNMEKKNKHPDDFYS
jgi:hypothetical protein